MGLKTGILVDGHLAGRAIVQACRTAGHEIHVIDTDTIDESTCRGLDAVIVAGAMHFSGLRQMMAWVDPDCHVVCVSNHAALPPHPRSIPWRDDEFDVTGEPLQDQGASQAAREMERALVLRGAAASWTILRPAIVESPSDPDSTHTRWFVDRVLSGEPVYLPDGDEQPYRHISTRDLASAVVAVLRQKAAMGRVLHACSDGVLSPSFHARAVAEALDRDLDLRFVDDKAWDQAGLARPMAGRSGSALLAGSSLLRELGWTPTSPGLFLRNLCAELAQQPRRADRRIRARERVLARPTIAADRIHPLQRAGWALWASSGAGPAIELRGRQDGSSFPWKTVAVALGEETERAVSAIGAMGIARHLCAPMLVRRQDDIAAPDVLVLGRPACDSLAPAANFVPVPSGMGVAALLAAPLARLLAAWPVDAPSGEVWILGRGVEALLASWLASNEGRSARILGWAAEEPLQAGGRGIEALKGEGSGRPAMVLNVSGSPEGEAIAVSKLLADGVLVTPFFPSVPLRARHCLRLLPDQPADSMLPLAFEWIDRWRDRLETGDWLHFVDLEEAATAFAAPALRLPVLRARERA